MKASELALKLNYLVEKHGDLDLVYSTDDEGNNYGKVYYDAGTGHFEDNDFDSECDEKDINCICIN